ncbi:S-adenosyl-L-methionine-dependent methyltransferase [Aspergillus minisclerotigenes]|uniref:S-adenosyl-L-methionine-dependent methyltransferase n=1 Tax=Aspergillus minisclerotigenes TaxID=656917 RepID=A0A5N6IZV0_9EURO|nr:S-adenosyl-L-methionine-dependent methyltransferase [Aspergillus minisclerotigenes]
MSQSSEKIDKIELLAKQILNDAGQCRAEGREDISLSDSMKKISSSCTEIASLAATPRNWVIKTACSYTTCMALSIILEFGLQKHIRDGDGTTSLDELVQMSGVNKEVIKMALSQCMLSFIFEEPDPEQFRHNDNSRMLLNENYAAWVQFRCDDSYTAGAYLTQSLKENNLQIAGEPEKRAWGIAYGTNKSFYEWYNSEDPVRGRRFDKQMAASLDNATYGVQIEEIFSFDKFQNATLVDVGGGRGQNSIRLAGRFPGMSFIVQDLYCKNDEERVAQLPANIRDKISWQRHDFTTPQPTKEADVYLLSQILMDHQPDSCRVIVKHLVDAMAPNHSVLLINDYMSPTGDEGKFTPMNSALNLHMLAILGRAFWSRKEWEGFFASVSPCLKLRTFNFTGGRVVFELYKEV